MYQWGRKDPFTFATKGTGINAKENGLNPLKIYNAQGKEIVQTLDGNTDTNGGTTIVKELALSMLEIVRKPNTFYAPGYNAFINQVGLTRDIWDYYWTSYSRGTDGDAVASGNAKPNVNNTYLNGYSQQRPKSVFDPCPYGFRIPTNGIYNLLPKSYIAWLANNYVGGLQFDNLSNFSWKPATGRRFYENGSCGYVGNYSGYHTATVVDDGRDYVIDFRYHGCLNNYKWPQSEGFSVRCIEECG